MPDIQVLFVDDGGVMNDNARRGPQWERLVGEYLAPRLGGDPAAWATANRYAAERVFANYLEASRSRPHREIRVVLAEWDQAWLQDMCERAGVAPPAPGSLDGTILGVKSYVLERVDAAFPGVPQALRALRDSGLILHTASGEPSTDLEGYLRGMGVRDVFGRLYGPDLVDAWKSGPPFYQALLADTGARPEHSAVVDDQVRPLNWAKACGLRTFLVAAADTPAEGHHVVASLSQLVGEFEAE